MSDVVDGSRRDEPKLDCIARGDGAPAGKAAGPPWSARAGVEARVRQLADWAKLETTALTAGFWLAVAGFVAAYWVTPLPPCIDYPQHLALGAIIRRMLDPSSPERQLYEFAPLSYNGLFHVLVAGLSLLVRPELAGKLLLSCIPVLTGAAALALARLGQRPCWYACFLLPFCYSHIVGWGFINYALSAPLALLVVTWWMRWRDGERRLLWRVVIGGLLVAYAHVLVAACLCLTVLFAMLLWRTPRELGLGRWLLGLLRAPLPVWPTALYSIAAFLSHRRAPHIFWEPYKDGQDSPAWEKLWNLSSIAVSNFSDTSDQLLFWLALAVLAVLFLAPLFASPAPTSAPRRELAGLAVTWLALYVLVPRVLMSTWYIFERLPLWWMAFALASAPIVAAPLAVWLRTITVGLGIAAGLNTLYHFHQIPDAHDASAIIDDIPAHARVTAVMHSSHADPALWRRIWVHLLAYHTVRRPGELAFSFTRYASLPVRYRAGKEPPHFPAGLEWNPQLFDPAAHYVQYFDTVLVRTPDDAPDIDPRALTFRYFSPDVRLLSRRGRFYLYDASGIADHFRGGAPRR